nr:unnamed protein product [Callosobruchus analis]
MDTSRNRSGRVSNKKKLEQSQSKENSTNIELRYRYNRLCKLSDELDKKIAELENSGVSTDLKPQMDALHRYNEMKDLTQMVLGYVADAEHVTVAELHKRFNLPMD